MVRRLAMLALCVVIVVVSAGCGSSEAEVEATAETEAETVSAKLVCADCAESGDEISVWQSAGTSTGMAVFSVPHGTTVKLLESKTADDGRTWYYVQWGPKQGWVEEDFVQQ
jgi:hypothetical protein